MSRLQDPINRTNNNNSVFIYIQVSELLVVIGVVSMHYNNIRHMQNILEIQAVGGHCIPKASKWWKNNGCQWFSKHPVSERAFTARQCEVNRNAG